ncbi:hypothetical protein GINT2_001709 [Glugoides intestinalis]
MEPQIKLYSSDGVEFTIDFELAKHSKTLELFLDSRFPFIQNQTREIRLPIHSTHLKRILEFMQYTHRKTGGKMETEFKVNDEETMELLEVASYLRI